MVDFTDAVEQAAEDFADSGEETAEDETAGENVEDETEPTTSDTTEESSLGMKRGDQPDVEETSGEEDAFERTKDIAADDSTQPISEDESDSDPAGQTRDTQPDVDDTQQQEEALQDTKDAATESEQKSDATQAKTSESAPDFATNTPSEPSQRSTPQRVKIDQQRIESAEFDAQADEPVQDQVVRTYDEAIQGVDITEDDVSIRQGGQVGLTFPGRQKIREQREQRIEADAIQTLEGQTGMDVTSEDVRVREVERDVNDDGQTETVLAAQPTDAFLEQVQEEEVASELDTEFDTEVSAGSLDVDTETGDVEITDAGTRRKLRTERLDAALPQVRIDADDYSLDDSGEIVLDENIQRRLAELDAKSLVEGTTGVQRANVRLGALSEQAWLVEGTTEAQRAELKQMERRSEVLAALDEQGSPDPSASESLGSDQNIPERETQADTQLSEERLNEIGTDQLSNRYPDATEDLVQSLEEETDSDLTTDDVVLRTEEGQLTASLSDEGEEAVEVQTTPGANLPGIGGVLTTGTRIRRDIRSATDPYATAWRENTPDKDDVYGLAGAAAPVAVAEPTPFGEVGIAVAVGTFATAEALVYERDKVLGTDPSAQAQVGIGTGITDTELPAPEEPMERGGELPPEQAEPTEIEVPEERTTIQPEELGVPRDAIQDGQAEITGPEGTEITDEGDIVIPAGTTQVAKQNRYEEEEEDEEEEAEEEEEERVVVEVPEEFIPDETVTIGEPEDTAESEDSAEEEATEETEEEEEAEDYPLQLPRQQQAQDDAFPDDTRADEEFAEREQEQQQQTTAPRELEEEVFSSGDFETVISAGGPSTTFGGLFGEQQEQESVTDLSPPRSQTLPFVTGREREDTMAGEQTLSGDMVGDMVGDAVGELDAALQGDMAAQQTGQLQAQQVAVESPLLQQNQFANPGQFSNPTQTQQLTESPGYEELYSESVVDEPTERTNRNVRLPEFDFGAFSEGDDEDEEGIAAPVLTDFLVPLTGERSVTTDSPSDDGLLSEVNLFE